MQNPVRNLRIAASVIAATLMCGTAAFAGPLAMTTNTNYPASVFREVMPQQEALPGEDDAPAAAFDHVRHGQPRATDGAEHFQFEV